MPIFPFTPQNLSNLPLNSKMVDKDDKISIERERFDNDMYKSVYDLDSRGSPSFLYNSDFNFLTGSGNHTITEATLSGTELTQNWPVYHSGGNVFQISAVSYASTDKSPTGSLNFSRFNIDTLGTELYMQNINYPSVAQFNQAALYNAKDLLFSLFYKNNNNTDVKTSISAVISTYGEVKSSAVWLKKNIGFSSLRFKMPNYTLDDLGANPSVQFKFNIEDIYGDAASFDLYYLKGEIGLKATPLYIDHVLEQLRINNLA